MYRATNTLLATIIFYYSTP